jgi:predicted glycosyltransferase
MHILVDISHPAHVHFFHNAVGLWRQRGHEVTIVSRDKDVALELLDQYGYQHFCLSRARRGLIGLGLELLEHEGRLYRLLRHRAPDVFVEIGGTFVVHAAKLLRRLSVVFYDTENARISNAITYPFASAICTPACYQGDAGPQHVRYNGYQELAYLHPNRFKPDPSVLEQIELTPNDVYIVARFVGWSSGHDLAQKGFSLEGKIELVRTLERFGRVLITSEAPMPSALERNRIKLPSSLIHHLLAFSTLYVGESATMASECSVLGVPAIFVSPVGRGYTDEQEREYGLCFTIKEEDEAIRRASDLLSHSNLKVEWQEKRHRLLAEKIDVTDWMVRFVEELIVQDGDLNKVQT